MDDAPQNLPFPIFDLRSTVDSWQMYLNAGAASDTHRSGFHSFASGPRADSRRLLPAIPTKRVVPNGTTSPVYNRRPWSVSSFGGTQRILVDYSRENTPLEFQLRLLIAIHHPRRLEAFKAYAYLMISDKPTIKRKASDCETRANASTMTAMNNPLINAAKKAKLESKTGASTKRKRPSNSITSSLFPSSQPASLLRYNTPDADPALDAAVRAMDTEAADLRRLSRVPQPLNASTSKSSLNPKFRFPTQTVSKPTSNGRRETIVDTSAPLRAEEDETPQIQRNKRLRAGAMAAIASNTDIGVDVEVDPMTPPRRPGQSAPGSTRRKSSVGRGKRISTSFQDTGVITQPHHSVANTSFYKHIDPDIPDSDRVRQLLIWCSARVALTAPSPSSSSSSSTSSSSTSPLPKLSEKAEAVLKAMYEDIVRKLAERRVDLSLFAGSENVNADSGASSNVKLAENKQNVTNQMWEKVYKEHIRSAEEEEDAWKKLSHAYDAYTRRVRSSIEKRRADLGISIPTSSPPPPSTSIPDTNPSPTPTPSTPSAKAQGKQRASSLEPHEQDLPPGFQAGFRLARDVLAWPRARRKGLDTGRGHDRQTAGLGPSTRKGVDPDSRPLPTSTTRRGYDVDVDVEMEEGEGEGESIVQTKADEDKVLDARMGDVEFKLDHLYVMASQARQTTEVAQMALDARFEMLVRALDKRRSSLVTTAATTAAKTPTSVFGRYVGMGAGGTKDRDEADEALALLRAIAREDAKRPPALVSDAARRGAREAQRAQGESWGERRITEVPVGSGVGLTPRKVPGTPRRGTTTPGREGRG
ncbi:hypothetical protein C0995_013539 [Termitomyces sp. Mi166|nr:hypothetical protein C0995_013539 [Termitomyces sp. Mi166\